MRPNSSTSRNEYDKVKHKTTACSHLKISRFAAIWLLPVLAAAVLYSIVITNNLFGDEFDQYKFSVIRKPRFGMSTTLDVHTQLGRLGHMIVREPWGIRLYSAVCALGSIVLLGKFSEKFLSPRSAILTMWIAALSPLLVEFGAEARPNAIFVFAGTLFLYAIVTFTENESWPNLALVLFSVCFGLLSRQMFVAVLFFGLAYYALKRRRITLKLLLICLVSLPLIARLAYRMTIYSNFAPKESAQSSVSLLSTLSRIPIAFSFGFTTLQYPERDVNFNVSIIETVSQNILPVLAILVVFSGLLIGFICYLRKNRKDACFLAGAITLPIMILIIVQETGFSILLAKHCAGVLGVYYILIAAIATQLFEYKWGKVVVILYFCITGLSLYHFYFQPEIYSRRSNLVALNKEIQNTLRDEDHVMVYYIPKDIEPNYVTSLAQAENLVSLRDDLPIGLTLDEYVRDVHSKCTGKILLIDSVMTRRIVDPNGCVLSVLKENRHHILKRYGRNLSLHVFTAATSRADPGSS
ncbi:MAG: hypothetical protein CEE38_04985 [Planctomycetes bacterium B3_Pla]|nr:MAG: hypothetical protein CEE38_04985 [Planctomycetes bacterium B3_Pla]